MAMPISAPIRKPRLAISGGFFLFLALFLLLTAENARAFVGQWKSFTSYQDIECLAEFQGRILSGTTGGLRSLDPQTGEEKVFNNLDGLLDVSITSLVKSEDGKLWVISKSGLVSEFDGRKFTRYGRGYAAERWTMNPRAAASGGRYLALGSSKGLTFFDVQSHAAIASLTRFGNDVGDSVLAVLRRGDTLYISTPKAVYKAAIDWQDLLSIKRYGSIFDPRIWGRVVFPGEDLVLPPDPVVPDDADTLLGEDDGNPDLPADTLSLDSLAPGDSSPALGKRLARNAALEDDEEDAGPFVRRYNQLVWENGAIATYGVGTVLPGKFRIEALADTTLKIRGIRYSSITGIKAILPWKDKYYAGGIPGLLQIIPAETSDSAYLIAYPNPTRHPAFAIANIAAYNGKVMGRTINWQGLHAFDGNGFAQTDNGVYFTEEVLTRRLRNLVADPDGDFFFGSWGQGLQWIRDGREKSFIGADECPKSVFDADTLENGDINPPFVVTAAISQVDKDGLWLGIQTGEDDLTSQIAYFDTRDSTYACPDVELPGARTHVATVLDDKILAMGTDEALYLFEYEVRPAKLKPWRSIQYESGISETWGVQKDGFDRVWALIGGKLAYVDSLESNEASKREPKVIESFSGLDCHVLVRDPVGGLWAGCQNGLFHIVPEVSVRASQITRYTDEGGLLSNTVYDVSVDPVTGLVWVATDRGVSRLEGGVARPKTSLSDYKVYPNPFRKQHRMVIFDQLPPDAEVRIHSQDGQTVKTFHPRDLTGGQAQWDGNNDAGRAVKSGVYLWTIQAGKQAKRGRLIVAR